MSTLRGVDGAGGKYKGETVLYNVLGAIPLIEELLQQPGKPLETSNRASAVPMAVGAQPFTWVA